MYADAKRSCRREVFAGAVLATAALSLGCSTRPHAHFNDYSYSYPETAYYSTYSYPIYSYSYPGYSYFYNPPYRYPHHWHGDWAPGGWDRRWRGHGWDHGGWHNRGRGQEVHGGGDRGGGHALPNSGSIARGQQYQDLLRSHGIFRSQ
jgi:hypothetical protein